MSIAWQLHELVGFERGGVQLEQVKQAISRPELDPACEPNFEDLVRRTQAGDLEAFNQLILATERRLFRFTVLLCGNRELAQDLCQSTMIKAFNSISKLKEPKKVMSWLVTIARNLYLDSCRSQPVAYELRESDVDIMLEREAASGSVQTILEVQQALASLDPDDRMILVTAHLEGVPHQEIADQLGVSVETFRVRLYRARSRFTKIFD